MFNPIVASDNIKNAFIDYISTSFPIGDQTYSRCFREELQKEGAIAKGPFLDISGSYQTGLSLQALMDAHVVSAGFASLEQVPEKEKELKIMRPLYLHQEQALRKAIAGDNLIVTTGTGSGKTECFLMPIINSLLSELEAGTLDDAVRAIIIYPMNALANDQMKRLRTLLASKPEITFGLYNGNTEHEEAKARSEYRKLYRDENGRGIDPLPNEVISRAKMQSNPPHILITNYSMLEYMMLRPKDDAVFSGAKLRYIVLDEAHIYKGATGMETSLLLRRLKARISAAAQVQYILTSATLGDEKTNKDVVKFAETLCDVTFRTEDIIRSSEIEQKMIAFEDFPLQMFAELAVPECDTAKVLADYHADYAPEGDTSEKLFELCLRSKIYHALRTAAKVPMTVAELCKQMQKSLSLSQTDLVNLITVCVQAEKEKTSLIKARYHYFVRALEGAYITLNQPRRLMLQRKEQVVTEDVQQAVFECAVCEDCGRVAIAGRICGNHLCQPQNRFSGNTEYFLVKETSDDEYFDDDADAQTDPESQTTEFDYVICPICGCIELEKTAMIQSPCPHNANQYVKLRKTTPPNKAGQYRCPACEQGHFKMFYLGNDAATAVLGTTLYEELPDGEKKARQFLAFSDSRSEAAFFASYMEKSYQEFLRRRGLWHVCEQLQRKHMETCSVKELADRLIRYFEENHTFVELNEDRESRESNNERNAWIAILNEMYNARRSTSLVTMGLFAFEYAPKKESSYQAYAGAAHEISEKYGLPVPAAKALLELLMMDIVYAGAMTPGKRNEADYRLTDAEREYIFFAPKAKCVTMLRDDPRKTWLLGWLPRKRTTGEKSYYSNARMTRVMRELGCSADEAFSFLQGFWKNILRFEETIEEALPATDFNIRIAETSHLQYFRCKKCGRVTTYNCNDHCASVRCTGRLEPYDAKANMEHNHYANLYRSQNMKPLYIKEHTAQLAKAQQTEYQNLFVEKKLNALSCSTTFEMGVDVGSLETIYLRNMPPSPANYVQRAGRAGRSLKTAAYALTFAKLSSHDLTYYEKPTDMISGKIKAPVFRIENAKVINRHIYAVALSAFFADHPEVYAENNQTVLLNEDGYDKLKEYLKSCPQSLVNLLNHSIPQNMQVRLGINDNTWIDGLIGETGVLELAIQDFHDTVLFFEHERDACAKVQNYEGAGANEWKLKNFRCSRADGGKHKSLIDFLVRNNVLPKYGFPVDTVELLPAVADIGGKNLQLARDLQLAIAEYAPGAEVIADNKMYTSRYIRKLPTANNWEIGWYAPECSNLACKTANFSKTDITGEGRACVACGEIIPLKAWTRTLEPRRGFIAESSPKDVPMRRPDKSYKTDDIYIGDPRRNTIDQLTFEVNGQELRLESTTNDSLVVVTTSNYTVCPVCGYATVDGEKFCKPHKNPYGYDCKNQTQQRRYLLSHDFKTDVAKISFHTSEKHDMSTMLSVLYALLEATAHELGIERTDIKGCLHKELWEGKLIDSIILYDAVAGGAGHVRRLVTADGAALRQVIEYAVQLTSKCDCEPSCYKCLRNYYNQKIHELLDRRKAEKFLKKYVGNFNLKAEELQNEEDLQLAFAGTNTD